MSGCDSDEECNLESVADSRIVMNNSIQIRALLEKVASLEKAAKAATESKVAEQGRWYGNIYGGKECFVLELECELNTVVRDVGMEDWKAKANVPDAHLRTTCST